MFTKHCFAYFLSYAIAAKLSGINETILAWHKNRFGLCFQLHLLILTIKAPKQFEQCSFLQCFYSFILVAIADLSQHFHSLRGILFGWNSFMWFKCTSRFEPLTPKCLTWILLQMQYACYLSIRLHFFDPDSCSPNRKQKLDSHFQL